jgi:hypothetical protein
MSTSPVSLSVAESLYDACKRLRQAYDAGEANGGSMEWNDVDDAFTRAKAAIAKFRRAAKKPLGTNEEAVQGLVAGRLLDGCEQLVAAYAAGKRNSDHVEWEDLDLAYEFALEGIKGFETARAEPTPLPAAEPTGARRRKALR